MIRKITIANQKGGVGKTALSANLAYFIAENHNYKDQKILFIDIDVQGNATSTLRNFNSGITSYQILSSELSAEQIKTLAEHQKEHQITVLSASKELANSETFNLNDCVNFLNNNLAKLEEYFDLVIFDTPPTLGNALVIILCCSESLIIPIELDTFSLAGLNGLTTTVSKLKKINKNLKIAGLVVNKYFENRKRQEELLNSLNQTSFKDLIFETKIHYTDLIPDSLSLNQSLRKTAKDRQYHGHRAIREFKSLTLEVLNKVYG